MTVLLSAATPFEIQPTLNHLSTFQHLTVRSLITGPGVPATIYALTRTLMGPERPDLLIHAGIGGAFDQQVALGTVFQMTSDCFADLGVQEKDGGFSDLFQLELLRPEQPPFGKDGRMHHPHQHDMRFLPLAHGITVNTVSGTQPRIDFLRKRYSADVESMEGAAVFYVCLLEEMPFLCLRSISNHVEPRQRDRWDLPGAIHALNQHVQLILNSLSTISPEATR